MADPFKDSGTSPPPEPEPEDVPRFDHHQFQNIRDDYKKLDKLFEPAAVDRMSIIKRKTAMQHEQPPWLKDRETLEAFLDERVANLPRNVDPVETKLRWLKIIHLYFIKGWAARDVAEEMGTTENAIEQLIKRLRD